MKQPAIYSFQDHQIDPSLIADEAKIVLKQLTQAGFTAYLVGGSVRDLCLGKKPKDFDIATSARPEQVKPLFRHCLLIGKRFRLAHVRFRHTIIEVATFRAGDTQSEELIIHDNTWGDPEEDALRRDFTINGLFYHLEDQTIIDYVEGFQDLKKHILRTIGDPLLRFRQDPVRMIRLLKFQARLQEMSLETATADALIQCTEEISKSSPARLLEELLRMLESGYSAPFFCLLHKHQLLQRLMPYLEQKLHASSHRCLTYLQACDCLRLQDDATLMRETLLSSLTYSLLEPNIQQIVEQTGAWPSAHDLNSLALDEMHAMAGLFIQIPKKMKAFASGAIGLQARLNQNCQLLHTRQRHKILRHPDFTAAFQLLRLRAIVDPSLETTLKQWQHYLSKTPISAPPKHEIRNEESVVGLATSLAEKSVQTTSTALDPPRTLFKLASAIGSSTREPPSPISRKEAPILCPKIGLALSHQPSLIRGES